MDLTKLHHAIHLAGLFLLSFCLLSHHSRADAPELSVRDALQRADDYSPDLKAALSRESQAKSRVGISKSNYLPAIDAEAIDSTGFPGSTAALGVAGLPGSPFRSGFSGGVVLTQDLFDFGRTYYSVKASESDLKSQEVSTRINRYQTEQTLIIAFVDCALNRAQQEIWEELSRDTELVAREVERFVKTGQRSIVDSYLARAQKEQAATNTSDYSAREQVSLSRVSLLTGITTPFSCPLLNENSDSLSLRDLPKGEDPFVLFAETRRNTAQDRLNGAKAENLPRLLGVASAGYLQGAHIVDSQNYSLGVGIVLPLFQGFRIKGEVDEAVSKLQEQEFLVESSRLRLENLNSQYDEKILSSRVRIENLNKELENGMTAFEVAKKRYLGFQGTLVDVRDSLTNLARVKGDLNEAKATYLESLFLKTVLNNQN